MAENITAHMDKSLESLKHNFSKVRTGRANANILSDITVDYYGVPTPVTQVAAVKTPEAHMLLIEPWDKALINAIVKAIGRFRSGYYPQLRWHRRSSSRSRLPLRSAVASSSRSAASTPSRPRCLSVTSVATSTTSSSAMRSSPRTMSVASRPRSRSTPMSMVAKVEELLKEKEAEVMEI